MGLLCSAQERYTAFLRIIIDFQWQMYIAFCKSSCHPLKGRFEHSEQSFACFSIALANALT